MTTEGFFERNLADVVDRLTRAGYTDSFTGTPEGVKALRNGWVHKPQELQVDQVARFEGVTDPEEEALVLALSCAAHGCRGTYVVPYGKNMSSVDGELISKIPDARKRRTA
ncbi:MAG TPA: hypothetical protein VEJ18_00015 [Planctomycetota bacterium]|nr:hypothetical protein [Planctomycetota bacterium]